MEHFYTTVGEDWFTYPQLYADVVQYFPSNSHFVEVGTWKGRSAAYMAVEIINSGKSIRFDCVDTWEYVPDQVDLPAELYTDLYNTFLSNIEPVKHIINPVRSRSTDAAKLYNNESLDFIFIDAAHDYENVLKDMKAWYPKLKSGGVFAGHDYSWSKEVKKAVHEFFGDRPIIEKEGCWIYNKILPL